ncbi:MAG: hypothetical protein COU27_02215 [Candidatus Levybacteria bacterium CG10_big_fil_rev_8_21_14_0_10_36_7]|nr:MAG: hypothetical protein COU27_02215 [Candidatus Levybacteria bacterium CG10_big_fil_rev_8_21_14_0_10_36_7]
MNNNKETHILIIWPKSAPFYEEIMEEISGDFEIKRVFRTRKKLSKEKWLNKFYSRPLSNYNEHQIKNILKDKKAQVGKGETIIVEIATNPSKYIRCSTTNGIACVNPVCIETKKKLRSITKNDLHLSDSVEDSLENQFHLNELLGFPFDVPQKKDGGNCIADFFHFLNDKKILYVSMRGHDFVYKDTNKLTNKEKDIDLLVLKEHFDILREYPFLTKRTDEKEERYTLSFVHDSKHCTCKIDIYPTKLGVFPAKFEEKILLNHEILKDIKIPKLLDRELLDLYNFVFHKRYLPKDKQWKSDILKDVSLKTPKEILKLLDKFGLNQDNKNPFYPGWSSLSPLGTFNRHPIKRKMQTKVNDKRYFSYVFENEKGQIVKEGDVKNIQNAYNILEILSKEIDGIVPRPLDITTNEETDFGSITMTKLEGKPFKDIAREFENFEIFKKYLYSAFNVIKIFKKHKIVHRDINPSNLLYSKDKIMFIDFSWSIIGNNELNIETPSGLNSGFYKDPKEHNDIYSTIRCFTYKNILPKFLTEILSTNDIDFIQKKIDSLGIIKTMIISLYLKLRRLLSFLARMKSKYKKHNTI